MRDAVGIFEHDNNPIGAWLAAAVESSDGMMVDRRDLLASLNGWMISEFGQDAKPFGGRTVFPAIRRAMPGTGDHRIGSRRYVTGVKLTDEGIGHIHDYADNNYGKQTGSGEADNFINKSFQDPTTVRRQGKEPRF